MGELQWTTERWKDSTFKEFNYAAAGYWRNWERFVGIPMRQICFTNISMTPGVTNRPDNAQEFWPLSIDIETIKKIEKPTEEDIRIAREGAKNILNGSK